MVILIKPAGSLSFHDGDVHENGNKAISLDWQNNNSARASSFFVNMSLPSLNDYGVKIRNFKFCGGREDKTMTFFSWTSIQSFRVQFQKKIPTLDEMNETE